VTENHPRVLLIAEAANPEWVSVPLVGWNIAFSLRNVARVHVVTQQRNTEAMVRAGWVQDEDFTALDSEAVAARMWKLTNRLRGSSGVAWTLATAMSIPSYYWFEHLFWKRFAAELRGGAWDIVHRVTPLSPTVPSLVASRLRRIGVPFMVGPLNGGVPWPREFVKARWQEREWLSYVRGAYQLLPGSRSMRDSSSAIVVGSRATLQQLGKRWSEKAVYIPENGIRMDRFGEPVARPPTTPLRIVFVGRLVPYKGADMLIESCAGLLKAGKVQLEIVGDGPQRALLERMVTEQGLSGGVTFAGWLNQAEVAARFSRSHVLGFPSVREFGGGVVLEAMASGVVPVVVDYAGPSELVTPATGYLVQLGPRQDLVRRLREQFENLVQAPEAIEAKSSRARSRVERWFTWKRKAEQISAVYAWVLRRGPKPDFGTPFPEE